MYFQFACEQCRKNLKVREENAGKKVRCPYCHHTQTVRIPDEQPDAPSIDIDTGAGGAPSGGGERKPRKKPASKPAPQAAGGSFTDATEVSPWLSAAFAVGGAVVFLLLMLPLRETYFGALFVQRGWVPPVLVFMLSWSLTILVFKWRQLQRQRESMLLDVIPADIAPEITPENVDRFTEHVRSLPADSSESFLVNRVLRGLEHFRVLKSGSEVADRLQSQSDIDANAVESSYRLLKVFIWAIPILGFIGTVIGISAAVGSFSGTMESAGDVSQLKDSLKSVTGGLATAFDTTLVALVMSIFVMFPASSLQKAEEDLVNWVDEYCNENLLKRLQDGKADGAASGDAEAIQKAIDEAMARHHAELESWNEKLEAVGSKLTSSMTKGWSEVDEKLKARHVEQAKRLEKVVTALGKLVETAESQSAANQERIERDFSQLVEQFGHGMTALAERSEQVQTDVSTSMSQSAAALHEYVSSLQEGLASLNRVLSDLGGQQVVVQQEAPKRKRGWFSRGNGSRR